MSRRWEYVAPAHFLLDALKAVMVKSYRINLMLLLTLIETDHRLDNVLAGYNKLRFLSSKSYT